MRIRRLIWLVTVISLAPAAEKKPPAGAASNPSVRIEATAYLDKESVRQVLGSELDASIVVLEVRLTPASGKSLKVFFDDFLLRSEKDGQRSGAFHPSQIAGNTVLRVGSAGGGGAGIMGDNTGPVWGGIGGRPRRIGGDGGVIGNAGTQEEARAVVDTSREEKESPLLALLKKKVLPEQELKQPASGLLYFLLEGKHKPKDLVLDYKGEAGKLTLRFQ